MKKSIKFLATLLSALTLCSMTLTGCNDKEGTGEATFESFADKTVEVGLGERYMLELAPILGSDGKYYSVTAKIADEAGEEVQPFGATLLMNSLEGYTVTYSIMDGDKLVKTVTVKLDVKYTKAPNIVLEDIKNVYAVGENFKLPQAEVYDVSKETLTPTMQILDAEGKELTYDTENGVFLCEKAGKYTLRVEATNGGGVKGEKLFPFKVEEFNQKIFKASAETLQNIDCGSASKNKLLNKADIEALGIDGFYGGDTAVQVNYINQIGYKLKGVNPWFSTTEIGKRKYITIHFAFYKEVDLVLPETSYFCFHAGDAQAEGAQMRDLLLGASNGFGGKVVFAENGKFKFNTWYQFTLPAEKYAQLLASKGDVKLFGIYEGKLHPNDLPANFPKNFRDKCKIIIGDIEVYDELVYDQNGDNFITEDYFS